MPQLWRMEFIRGKIEESIPKSIRTLSFQSGKEPTSLTDIEIKDTDRVKLGITELDHPLGGGIVSDSVILWGGEPGIGKSTLILQICDSFTKMGKLYYIAVVRNQIYRLNESRTAFCKYRGMFCFC